MPTRRGLLGLLAGGALALLAGRWIAGQYADWALHHALGFNQLWRLKATTLALLRAGTFVTVAAFAFAHLLAVRHSIVSLVLPSQLGGLEIPEEVPTRRLTLLALGLAICVAIGFTLLPQDWSQAALAWQGVRFGEADPYLERDLGFYATWLPWERALQARSMALTIVVGALVVGLYALTPSLRFTPTGLYVSTWVRRHLAVLGGTVLALVGWGWRLDRFERMSPGSGVWLDAGDAAFGAFDHRIALPYRVLASIAALPIAAVLVFAGWRGHLRTAFTMVGAMILLGPVATAVLPLAAKRSSSAAEATQRDRPYRATAALYTRRAFGVDEIAREGVATVPVARLSRSVSAWDPAALSAGAGEARARDTVMGVAWSAGSAGLELRSLHQPRPSADAPWSVTRHLAAAADDAGQPFFAPNTGSGRLAGVRVYPGAGGPQLLADPRRDLAAPAFERTGQRIALAWAEQDPRLLLREVPDPQPRMMLTRDLRERLTRVLPFYVFGPTTMPVLRGDSLYWFVEAFTAAARYPLSAGVSLAGREYRYLQHAATVVVQAQTGRMLVLPVERPEAIQRAWMQRIGATFTPLQAAPEWLRQERPPAVDWALVQGAGLALVGFRADSIGARRLARADDADPVFAGGAPTLFALDTVGTLAWSVPVDLPWAGRTLGLLVARGGAARRTEYVVAESPRWTTILEELQGSADRAGIGGARPDARRGRVQAIPTPEGVAWVQSHYEWPPDGRPRLAGVVVSRGGQTRAARTLAEALGERPSPRRLEADAFRARVAGLYEAMQAALRVGDWRAYGEAWAALGDLLQRP